MTTKKHDNYECKKTIMAVHDAMDVLNGKWKISIVAALCFNRKRYSDLLKDVRGISGKMLSRELKEMELNQLVKRTVFDTQPVTVQYELTPYGQNLKTVIKNLAMWGLEHRKQITGK
ncbi:helix-turn-helix domain-containing protein [Pedobacter gandavensis]|uniref:winged helix-turn-helix transcriptional regulator n=1 Tax=Pedobacter gandavensis TaxID=2679963 RepID=UPI00292DF224|nr:helix-turn-helix domain-containing protein [Pedobacter gandavensis]